METEYLEGIENIRKEGAIYRNIECKIQKQIEHRPNKDNTN